MMNKGFANAKEIDAIIRFRGNDKNEVLETERLLLLPSVNGRDLEEYHRHLTTEGDFYYQYGMKMTDEILHVCDFESNGVKCFTIFLKSTNEMIGYVGLSENGNKEANLEFYIFKDFRQNGYCFEAARKYIDAYFDHEFDDIWGDKVTATTFFENEPAKGVLLKLGFKSQGIGIRMVPDETEGETDYDCGGMIVSYVLERREQAVAA